jgi:hypothetical protein
LHSCTIQGPRRAGPPEFSDRSLLYKTVPKPSRLFFHVLLPFRV